jgi:hypothetical protein
MKYDALVPLASSEPESVGLGGWERHTPSQPSDCYIAFSWSSSARF